MAIRVYKPTSPARRFMSVLTYEELTKKAPERSLTEYLKKNAGRNNQGKITVRHQGGGNKVKYRIIDFKRNKDGVPAKVATIEYDPNRSARIALLHYADGEKRYILAPRASRSVRPSCPVLTPTSSRATLCPSPTSPSVRSSTPSSSSRARALLSPVPPVTPAS